MFVAEVGGVGAPASVAAELMRGGWAERISGNPVDR